VNALESLVVVLVDHLTLYPNAAFQPLRWAPTNTHGVFQCLIFSIYVIHQTLWTILKKPFYLMSMCIL